MSKPDVRANFPFAPLPEILIPRSLGRYLPLPRSGSFMQSGIGVTDSEDKFMEMIWRVKTWKITCNTDVKWYIPQISPYPDIVLTVFHREDTVLFGAGIDKPVSSSPAFTQAYQDPEDILVNPRFTELEAKVFDTALEDHYVKIFINNAGGISDARDFGGGVTLPFQGVLDSYFLLDANYGSTRDVPTTDFDSLDDPVGQSVTVQLKMHGQVLGAASLYKEKEPPSTPPRPPRYFQSLSPIIIEPHEWWEYREVASNPATATWNQYTGAQLLDPLRFTPDNSRGRFFVQV